MTSSNILEWLPVTSFAYTPYFASVVFDPTLCQLLQLKNSKKIRCTISDTDIYDGTYMCTIDDTVACTSAWITPEAQYTKIATLATPWIGVPPAKGTIKF